MTVRASARSLVYIRYHKYGVLSSVCLGVSSSNSPTWGYLDNIACFQMRSRLRIYIIGLQIGTRVPIWIIQLALKYADGGAFM